MGVFVHLMTGQQHAAQPDCEGCDGHMDTTDGIPRRDGQAQAGNQPADSVPEPVSYTHLTLPTTASV